MSKYIDKIRISKNDEKPTPDSASIGALSNWLETDKQRLRVVTYPSGYEADHACYNGHPFFVASGKINIKHGDEISVWNQRDAFIILDEIPHLIVNPFYGRCSSNCSRP